jgi:hypothetical protein
MIDEAVRSFRVFFLKGIMLWGLALWAVSAITAQERESAKVYHVKGRDFAIMLNNQRVVFPAEQVRGEGIRLERSGVINTGPGTDLELYVAPSGSVIKLSENTSLVYNGLDSNGNFAELGLLYGRIRVISGMYPSERNSIVVRSGGVSIHIREGDFGVDCLLDPGVWNSAMRPIFRVHAFRGTAEVFPNGREAAAAYFGGAQSIAVGNWESLSIDVSSAYTFAEKKLMGNETVSYWRLNNFAGTPPGPMPPTEINDPYAAVTAQAEPAPAAESQIIYIPAEIMANGGEQPGISGNSESGAALTTGVILTAVSAAFQGICYPQIGIPSGARARAAYGVLSLGLVNTVAGLLGNNSGR